MLEAANRLNDAFIDFAYVVPLLFPVSFCRGTPYEADTNYCRMFNARTRFGAGAEADQTMMACAEHTPASATATPASVTTPIKDSATERVGQTVSHYGSAERQKLKLDLDQPVVQGTFASVKGKGTRSGSLNFLEHVYGDCRAAGR